MTILEIPGRGGQGIPGARYPGIFPEFHAQALRLHGHLGLLRAGHPVVSCVGQILMGWVRARILDPILGLLRHGLSPEGLAWSLAVGFALGVIPLLGASTVLCVGVALAFRLNQPAIQLANYLAYPLQILLLFPFIRMGEGLFGTHHETISLAHIQAALRADAWGAIRMFWTSLWHASVAWLLVVPIPMILLAWGLRPIFRRALKSFRRP